MMGENNEQTERFEQLEMLIRQRERICILIDNSCLFAACKSRHNLRLDYKKLGQFLADKRRFDVRFYYSEDWHNMVDEEKKKRRKFYSFLEHQLNFLMVELPLRKRMTDTAVNNLVSFLRKEGKSDQDIMTIAGKSSGWLRDVGKPQSIEKGLDCEIVYDLVQMSQGSQYQGFILVSGDEDFARTVRKLRRQGWPVDVAFFDQDCSTVLKGECRKFVDLTGIHDLFRSCYTGPSEEASASFV
jgi:uncharacterized LabA/DUF88 family protein